MDQYTWFSPPFCFQDFVCYYLLIRGFHISSRWWSFTGDWVTASLFTSPGLFSVFWPSSVMLFFGWSPLGRQLPYYYNYYYYYFTSVRIFTRVIESLFKSQGHFSVFLTVLTFGWSPDVFLFPILPVSSPTFWWLYRTYSWYQCHLHVFLVSKQGPGSYLFFAFLPGR